MPNLMKELKAEITRLAKKEVKKATSPTRKRNAALRKRLADKKRRIIKLEKRVAKLEKLMRQPRPTTLSVSPDELKKARIGPKLVKAQRKRLKISQGQLARLLNVSPAAVQSWEQGRSRPQEDNLKAFVAVRKMKPSEVRDRLPTTPKKNKRVTRKKRTTKKKRVGKKKRVSRKRRKTGT